MILRIQTPSNWDYTKFVESVADDRPVSFVGCKVYEVRDILFDFRTEIEDAILQSGLSNLLDRQLLTQDLVPPGERSERIRDVLCRFLHTINVDEELIIVDPYLFAFSNDPDYPRFLGEILRPFADKLMEIKVITDPSKVDLDVKLGIMDAIADIKDSIVVSHTASRDYHDRFWISCSRSRGILTGSSLNGLGKRYALVDRLADTDVKEIVDSLIKGKLI